MGDAELEAFAAECEALEDSLAAVPDDDWSRPALGEWSLAELGAHVCVGVGDLARLPVTESGSEPVCDRVGFWRVDLAAMAGRILDRARQAAEDMEAREVPERFARTWRQAVQRFEAIGAQAHLASPRGPMLAVEYLATRVVEVVVHHHDVRAALDLPPRSTPAAERLVLDILEALLGERRPRNFGRQRFILAATGRLDVDDPRYPLLR